MIVYSKLQEILVVACLWYYSTFVDGRSFRTLDHKHVWGNTKYVSLFTRKKVMLEFLCANIILNRSHKNRDAHGAALF